MTYYEAKIVSLDEENGSMIQHLHLGKFISLDDVFDHYEKTEFVLDFDNIQNPHVAVAVFDQDESVQIDCPEHGYFPGVKIQFYKLTKE